MAAEGAVLGTTAAAFVFAASAIATLLLGKSWLDSEAAYKASAAAAAASSSAAAAAAATAALPRRKRLFTPCFSGCSLLALASLACFWAVSLVVAGNSALRRYEPFTVLEVPEGASERDVTKAYRRLSLRYHPDKVTGDEKIFREITRAYKALTDPLAMANMRDYGNPEGDRHQGARFGMPQWATGLGDSKDAVLIGYLVVIAILGPVVFLCARNGKTAAAGDEAVVDPRQAQRDAQLAQREAMLEQQEALAERRRRKQARKSGGGSGTTKGDEEDEPTESKAL